MFTEYDFKLAFAAEKPTRRNPESSSPPQDRVVPYSMSEHEEGEEPDLLGLSTRCPHPCFAPHGPCSTGCQCQSEHKIHLCNMCYDTYVLNDRVVPTSPNLPAGTKVFRLD